MSKPTVAAWPEAQTKAEVRKVFAEFGCPNPYMPSAGYGSRGAADFIECMYGRYIAVETKKTGAKQTKLQWLFQKGVERRGGTYLLINQHNIDDLRELFWSWEQ